MPLPTSGRLKIKSHKSVTLKIWHQKRIKVAFVKNNMKSILADKILYLFISKCVVGRAEMNLKPGGLQHHPVSPHQNVNSSVPKP